MTMNNRNFLFHSPAKYKYGSERNVDPNDSFAWEMAIEHCKQGRSVSYYTSKENHPTNLFDYFTDELDGISGYLRSYFGGFLNENHQGRIYIYTFPQYTSVRDKYDSLIVNDAHLLTDEQYLLLKLSSANTKLFIGNTDDEFKGRFISDYQLYSKQPNLTYFAVPLEHNLSTKEMKSLQPLYPAPPIILKSNNPDKILQHILMYIGSKLTQRLISHATFWFCCSEQIIGNYYPTSSVKFEWGISNQIPKGHILCLPKSMPISSWEKMEIDVTVLYTDFSYDTKYPQFVFEFIYEYPLIESPSLADERWLYEELKRLGLK